LHSLQTILWFLVAISILVAIHEYGHFFVARRCGVKVLRFSIGFGPRIFSHTSKSGTEYALSAIPLGGYVKMLDGSEGSVPPDQKHRAFDTKKPWQKIIIAFAGPLANFLLAIVLYALYAIGVGDTQRLPIIGDVTKGSIAEAMGLERGQQIVAIDDQSIRSTEDVLYHLVSRLGETGEITVTTTYPDSNLRYISTGELNTWLKGENEPDPVKGLGIEYQKIRAVVGSVQPDSPAQAAGLQQNDEIIATNGIATASWSEWVAYVQARPNEAISLSVKRDGQIISRVVTPALTQLDDGGSVARVGITLGYDWEEYFTRKQFGVIDGIGHGLTKTWETTELIFISLKKLVLQEISIKNLSGPVGIAKVAGDSAKAGFWVFISFLAMISVSLGVLNLLPVPVLDGGHIVYSTIEWIKGSPVSQKAQAIGYQMGLIMVLALTVVALYNDITKL